MQEKACNFWLESAAYRCIPTTGALQSDGTAVMDSGLAKEAVDRFAGVETDLGRLIASRGNRVHEIKPGLLSFPIKQFLWAPINLDMVRRSVREVIAIVGTAKTVLPRPPQDASGPTWENVKAVLAEFPDNVVVIQHV